ncbi:hypothetical protein QAD02_006805 [Eretmocerus hayati]|uniref:Uncharacterized protein n=1 Tax=Eretmocerus hayati TaxID=131215 RepID=A0ACC2N2D1_9HYME|nr:hypothetical protein QAD02_006805 [Eretmocerus hayati]
MGRLLFKICGLREISFRSVLQCTLKEAVIPRIRQNNLHNLSGRATGADQKNVTSDPRSKLFYEIVAKTMAQREKRYLTDPNAQLTFYMMRKMRRVCEEIDDAAPMPQNAQVSTPQPPPILNSSVEMCEMQRQLGTHITMPVVENLIGEMSCGPLTTEKQTESIVIMDDVPPRGNGIDPGDTLLHAEEMLSIPLEDLVDKPCGATDNSDDISQEALWSDDEESQNGHPGSVRYPYMIPAPKPRTVEHTLASAQKALTTGKAQDGVVTVSPLFKLNGFDPIWGFSPEYMHFQLCGNVKQFTEEIISTLSPSEFELVNRLIVEIRAPNQLCRLSKSLQFKSEYKSLFSTPEPMQEQCKNHKGKPIDNWQCVSLCQQFLPMPYTMIGGFCKDDICNCSWVKFKGQGVQKPVAMRLDKIVPLRKEMDRTKTENGNMKKFKNLGWLMTADKLPSSYHKPGPSKSSNNK